MLTIPFTSEIPCGISILQSALLFDFQVLGLLSSYLSGNVLEVGDSRIEFGESAWDNADNTREVGEPLCDVGELLWNFCYPVSSDIQLPSFRSPFRLHQRRVIQGSPSLHQDPR
jgi:hypothetical protein